MPFNNNPNIPDNNLCTSLMYREETFLETSK
jgi:hypothetical protein